jgi:hypothetical protein
MKKLVGSAVLALGLAIVAGGCVAAIGNRGEHAGNGTLGQELIDLKKAKDAGVISDAEYEQQRARLLDHK